MSLHGLLGIISPSYGDEMTNLHTPYTRAVQV
jgi:hypothetical protein